jgi:hypothetical protein
VTPPAGPDDPPHAAQVEDAVDVELEELAPTSRGFGGGPVVARDTDATPFTAILQAFLDRVPGAYAAALVDSQGETVDYTGRGDPFDLRVAAAHLQLVLQGVARFGALGEPRWIVVRGVRKSVAATALPDGYALALLLHARSAFSTSTRALRACMRALAGEAGWKLPLDKRAWYPVLVETDGRGRPIAVRGETSGAAEPSTEAAEVLGVLTGLSVRERGFRVRMASGGELTLVREPGGRWYADEASNETVHVRPTHEKPQ